ncbi:MAG TPA: polyprenol phosphomannose-dependent alpha 1,6 mannosyltransferase MptB [Candidatus Corynebacterium avicola]|uniref:Polyprenol phosphomannose-dependent alpha 1,6 mannosyltransferase MptB n=1 Tax=Candidatus Corynebacterium avicola TaxID=2838527 RepID=A0A9D1RM67_9CORY|nr:polyprenol phosphomannose-dependent alpha 1,6 mannosyltransferase MptB [Candidatus Corynebacterium avicola]
MLTSLLPDLGLAGSRSALLHTPKPPGARPDFTARDLLRYRTGVFVGIVGSILIAVGGLGAGALPVVGNSLWAIPAVSFLSRMLHTTTVTVFVGIALLVLGWLMLWRFCLPARVGSSPVLPMRSLQRTFVLWVIPLVVTAPMFTQDIYSYLAQGSIAAQGMDPYSGGPVDILGVDDDLARSVPFEWSHSPAPYGPVAVGIAALISLVTGDVIGPAVVLHRLVSILAVAATAWAVIQLARRCSVRPQAALWLGILNPLVMLHLVAGVHNEAVMMGLLLCGVELGLRAADPVRTTGRRWAFTSASILLICCAGMVKVTAFLALGFVGVAIARLLGGRFRDLLLSAALFLAGSVAVVSAVSLGTGLGFGWILVQGGATEIISWMSLTTDVGLLTAGTAQFLGLGDHTAAALGTARVLGLMVGGFWVVRMLWASYRGRIHPVGGLGVATFMLVVFFPVVHPWYVLWAIMPLAAWANQRFFRLAVVAYSVVLSFFILPRGLNLPPATVTMMYLMSAGIALVIIGVGWLFYRRRLATGYTRQP